MSLPLSTTLHLARTRTPADRSRVRLATAALAFSGALVINAVGVVRIGPGDLDNSIYSNYIAETGLRSGLAAILVILALLSGGLAFQALRIGTAARERRLAALRLAGASERQVRRLSVADASLVGLAGGLLAGPLYVMLTAVFAQLPRMARLFPGLSVWDVLVWFVIIGLLTLGGAAIGYLLHRDLPSATERPVVVPARLRVVVGVVLLLAGLASAPLFGYVGSAATILGLGTVWWNSLPWLGRRAGQRLMRSDDPVSLLTGARLVADARATARMGSLLFCCGFVIGALVASAIGVTTDRPGWSDREFYLTGFALSMIGILLIAVISLASFTVGVADQLVDQRRQFASLTALGVDAGLLRRVIRRQLLITAGPTLCVGLVVGVCMGLARLVGGFNEEDDPINTLYAALVLLVLGWAVASAGAALAGYLLRYQLRDALDPENLRAA
ncbi:FtsX-like permease family protein [Kribbella sp. CA-253562]|uniref:FtsX-like permease family protein n=1 Tax=Kribbella sp. CA-253562 TaxID=3239942 RepID=UPI003D8CF164